MYAVSYWFSKIFPMLNLELRNKFSIIFVQAAKFKKHVPMTLDLHDLFIVTSKQRNHKLTGARRYVRGFSTFMQLLTLKNNLISLPSITLYSNFLCLFFSLCFNLNVRWRNIFYLYFLITFIVILSVKLSSFICCCILSIIPFLFFIKSDQTSAEKALPDATW